MNVQEVIDDHEERIAATPQKPHIKSAAFDWDSKCTCANMYPKLKYVYPCVSSYHIAYTGPVKRSSKTDPASHDDEYMPKFSSDNKTIHFTHVFHLHTSC